MDTEESQKKKKQPSLQDLWRLILAIVAVLVIVRELRKPPDERSWHGKLGFFPYDFRKPTFERFRDAYWNPGGPIISAKPWGVGWTPNFGVVKRWVSAG